MNQTTIEVNGLRLTVGWRLYWTKDESEISTNLYLTRAAYQMVKHYTRLEYFQFATVALIGEKGERGVTFYAQIRAETETE